MDISQCLIGALSTLSETEQFRSANEMITRALRAVSEPQRGDWAEGAAPRGFNVPKGPFLLWWCCSGIHSGASEVEFIFPNTFSLVTLR